MGTSSESQTHHLLLFGDQAVDQLQLIRSLVTHSKTSPLARHFLRAVTDTVQLEYAQLSRYEHGWQGNIGSLLSLAEENAEREARGDKDYMMALVLTCIGRLGELIVYVYTTPLSHEHYHTRYFPNMSLPCPNIIAVSVGTSRTLCQLQIPWHANMSCKHTSALRQPSIPWEIWTNQSHKTY